MGWRAPLGWPVMPSVADRPLVFLDVDGPLIPFAARPNGHQAERLTVGGNPLLDRLNPDDGRHKLRLAFSFAPLEDIARAVNILGDTVVSQMT